MSLDTFSIRQSPQIPASVMLRVLLTTTTPCSCKSDNQICVNMLGFCLGVLDLLFAGLSFYHKPPPPRGGTAKSDLPIHSVTPRRYPDISRKDFRFLALPVELQLKIIGK